jgi:hypothetical protein
MWKTKPLNIFMDYLHGVHLRKLNHCFYRYGQFNQENPWELMGAESPETLMRRETSAEIIDCLIRCASMSFVCPKSLYDQTWRLHDNDKRRAPPPKQRPSTEIVNLRLPRAAELTTVELKAMDKLMNCNNEGKLQS